MDTHWTKAVEKPNIVDIKPVTIEQLKSATNDQII